MLTFSVGNFLRLYIFFEASLVPTLLVIVGWGYQTERLQAGVYFLFYTIASSLPLLVVILLNYRWNGSLEVGGRVLESFYETRGLVVESLKLLALTRAFLVKMPLFFVHL
jgi:NADH-ubiquinone oxidoreductase chain 4